MTALHNRVNRKELKQRLAEDSVPRTTLSFYRYVRLMEPHELRDVLFREWNELGVLGRIYLAHEGINAQLSVPTQNFETFRERLNAHHAFADVPLKIAVDDDGKSFFKLTIKVRPKLVNDGLDDDAYDVTNVGSHLTAEEFNSLTEKEQTLLVDMRNAYETEVGYFKGAHLPESNTFRDVLPEIGERLKGKEENDVVLYCTGGIRCEKASAWLRARGFRNVHQLHGGIIDYVQQVRRENLENRFIGKNFVFDERLGERVTEDVIASCYQCGTPCDTHVNCAHDACHRLLIQCPACSEKYEGCCSEDCLNHRDVSGTWRREA